MGRLVHKRTPAICDLVTGNLRGRFELYVQSSCLDINFQFNHFGFSYCSVSLLLMIHVLFKRLFSSVLAHLCMYMERINHVYVDSNFRLIT